MEIGLITGINIESNPFFAIRDLGLTTVQVRNWDVSLLTPEIAAKVKRDIDESGIHLAAFWGGYSGKMIWNAYGGSETCGLVPRDMRAQRVEELKKGAEFAKLIGAPALVTHCGFIPENPMDALYTETVEAIHAVASHCKELGIEFWFETGQETPQTLLRTIEDVALDNLGINLDTANLLLYGRGNPADALEVFGKYVRNLHIKDGFYPTDGRTLGKETAFGEGYVDFDRIIRKLYALNFTGELIIEREIDGPQQLIDIQTAKNKLEELLAKYQPGR